MHGLSAAVAGSYWVLLGLAVVVVGSPQSHVPSHGGAFITSLLPRFRELFLGPSGPHQPPFQAKPDSIVRPLSRDPWSSSSQGDSCRGFAGIAPPSLNPLTYLSSWDFLPNIFPQSSMAPPRPTSFPRVVLRPAPPPSGRNDNLNRPAPAPLPVPVYTPPPPTRLSQQQAQPQHVAPAPSPPPPPPLPMPSTLTPPRSFPRIRVKKAAPQQPAPQQQQQPDTPRPQQRRRASTRSVAALRSTKPAPAARLPVVPPSAPVPAEVVRPPPVKRGRAAAPRPPPAIDDQPQPPQRRSTAARATIQPPGPIKLAVGLTPAPVPSSPRPVARAAPRSTTQPLPRQPQQQQPQASSSPLQKQQQRRPQPSSPPPPPQRRVGRPRAVVVEDKGMAPKAPQQVSLSAPKPPPPLQLQQQPPLQQQQPPPQPQQQPQQQQQPPQSQQQQPSPQQPPNQPSPRPERSVVRPRAAATVEEKDMAPPAPPDLVELRGTVKRITFSNGDNGFSVIKVEADESGEVVTVVGNFAKIHPGAGLCVKGEWKKDAKWGRQLRAHEYVETAPATQAGIESYLASGLVRGIGPVAARQIVQHFGADTLTILEDEPDRLMEVEGIGRKKAETIAKAWQEQKNVSTVMVFLQSHNVTTTLATKIYKAYGSNSVDVVLSDPYRLVEEVSGIGFRTVDRIAQQLGFDPHAPSRYRSGLLFLLREGASEGDCFARRNQLLRSGAKLLTAPMEDLSKIVDELIKKGEVVEKQIEAQAGGASRGEKGSSSALFLPFYDNCETQCARRIRDIVNTPNKVSAKTLDHGKIAKVIADVQRDCGMVFEDVQLEAVSLAGRCKFMVLTGGPGTGKTTTTLGIIKLFESLGAELALAAPTGRAAKRLEEATGASAKTLHRLLEYSPETKMFNRNSVNPLSCDVLVVDEASMVDVVLMSRLLESLKPSTTVVLVGDVDQLPSVGPGNVLKDIIDSEQVEVVRLTRIFRQAKTSGIVTNAHRINRGELPDMKREKEGDFFMIEEEDPSKIIKLVTDLCVNRLPKHYKMDPVSDIQVLCPVKKGEVGTHYLNSVLQKALNPSNPSIKYGGTEFRENDKVMQIKNNYEKSVYNGAMGTIADVDIEKKSLSVVFDGTHRVQYDATELDQIVLGYAATVHKAQGSEFRIVVAPFHTRHQLLLQRNLLYTCVTRAKDVLVLVGMREAISRAVQNVKPLDRNSMLRRRIQEAIGKPVEQRQDRSPLLPQEQEGDAEDRQASALAAPPSLPWADELAVREHQGFGRRVQ